MDNKIMKGKSLQSSISENPFQRMKRVYINQLIRNDPRPNRVTLKQIIQGLYLGSVGAAYNQYVLTSLRITHILTICECLPPKFPTVKLIQQFEYKVVQVPDEPSVKLSVHFKECVDFIKQVLDNGGRILVHCFAGVSRSATIVVVFLLRYRKMSLQSALVLVRSARPQVAPNYGFMNQLRRYNVALQNYRKKHPEDQQIVFKSL